MKRPGHKNVRCRIGRHDWRATAATYVWFVYVCQRGGCDAIKQVRR